MMSVEFKVAVLDLPIRLVEVAVDSLKKILDT